MRGICHKCLTSDVELFIDKGTPLCQNCFGGRYPRRKITIQDQFPPSIADLKKRLERKY